MASSPNPQQAYDELTRELQEIAVLSSIGSTLSWDEQTFMPAGAADHRANQFSLIARLSHQRFTTPRVGELLAIVEQSPLVSERESDVAANVRQIRRKYDRSTKLPTAWVEE